MKHVTFTAAVVEAYTHAHTRLEVFTAVYKHDPSAQAHSDPGSPSSGTEVRASDDERRGSVGRKKLQRRRRHGR